MLQHFSTLRGHHHAKYFVKHIKSYKIAFKQLRSQCLQFILFNVSFRLLQFLPSPLHLHVFIDREGRNEPKK